MTAAARVTQVLAPLFYNGRIDIYAPPPEAH